MPPVYAPPKALTYVLWAPYCQNLSSTGHSSKSTKLKTSRLDSKCRMPTQGALARFFLQHSKGVFLYNSQNAPTSEFRRLCAHLNWKRGDEKRENACREFKDALTQQFNANYGTNSEDLVAWQNLCIRLQIQPVPDNLRHCRQIVTRTHVNLVDLVHASGYKNTSQPITLFNTVKELSEYTIQTGKYFPRTNVHAGDLLKHLLRQILNPSLDRRGGKRPVV